MSNPKPTEPAQGEFAFELTKLLLQVAWADDAVAPKEAEALLAFGKKSQLTREQLALLAACLAGKAALPPPNFGFLKARRLTMSTSLGKARMTFLSLPNSKLSAMTSAAYRLIW